jgi:predicted GH43/DUF377 family glycosyl hydrolase
MKLQWKRLGRVFLANGQYPWMMTHAAYPTIEHLRDDLFRFYVACRDKQNRSHIAFVDIDLNDPTKILQLSSTPVLAPGPRGSFDDSGVTPCCFLSAKEQDYLYYTGWTLGVTVMARDSIGLGVRAKEQGAFQKYSPAPILDRNTIDPLTLTYCCVLPRAKSGYRMWYNSNLTWGERDEEMQHVVKYAESDDGIHWRRDGKIVIGIEHPGEYAISRPTVVADRDALRMWYCWRGDRYRLGYALSENGTDWKRLDHEAGLEPEPGGWEQGSVHYPCVFDHKGQRFMAYNGGRYGSGGFGLAVLEKPSA